MFRVLGLHKKDVFHGAPKPNLSLGLGVIGFRGLGLRRSGFGF